MKNRRLVEQISGRLAEKAPLMQVILGPRQVGKTTAVKSVLGGKGVYETADYPTPLPFSVIEEWWQKGMECPDRILAIDEIQKIPQWSEVIKRLWDQTERQLRVLLTGSAALLVEKGLKETLAGRFEIIRAEHWNFAEANHILKIDLEKYIEFGCYPGSVPFLNDIERWGQYIRDAIIEPAIGRDLLQLHPVDNPALLKQVFGVAVSLPAQIISLQKMQGQLQGKGTLPTIQNYLNLLKHAFLVTGIEKYSTSAFKIKKSSPKIIIHDNALLRAFERPIQSTISAKKWGYYFENLIGARFLEAGWETFYWKDRKLEVDFVVLGPKGQKWALEVKTSKTTLGDLKGLFEFCKNHPDFEPCLISLENQKFADVRTIPTKEILSFCSF